MNQYLLRPHFMIIENENGGQPLFVIAFEQEGNARILGIPLDHAQRIYAEVGEMLGKYSAKKAN